MGPVRTNDAETWTPIVKESGGSPGVSAQEEGIHQVSGESSGRAREPEQGLDWGAQVAQGALLQSKDRLKQRFGGCASRNQGLLSLFFFVLSLPFCHPPCVVTSWIIDFSFHSLRIFFSLSFDHVLLCKDPEGLLGWKNAASPRNYIYRSGFIPFISVSSLHVEMKGSGFYLFLSNWSACFGW